MAEISLQEINCIALENPANMIEKAEEEYEKKVQTIANRIASDDNIKLVLLAGPSGSGKTTTANLVRDAVETLGEEAIVVSLDDFYRDQDDPLYPMHENGEKDYECPEALDLPMLTATLKRIVDNLDFEIPKYEFKKGRKTHFVKHGENPHRCVIIEGLHALNPIISEALPKEKILKVFVSVSTNINEDNCRILSGRKIRFVRRLVRDSIYRDADVYKTLSMWHGVLAAEDIYLYPYKNTADIAFNTFHTFELGVMRHYVLDLIPECLADSSEYINTVLSAINKIVPIDESIVPEDSLIREFIQGGIYEKLY